MILYEGGGRIYRGKKTRKFGSLIIFVLCQWSCSLADFALVCMKFDTFLCFFLTVIYLCKELSSLIRFSRLYVFSHIRKKKPCHYFLSHTFHKNSHLPFGLIAAGVYDQTRLKWYLVLQKHNKRLLLRCMHHFKSNLINNIDHMCTSGNKSSSVILRQTKWFQKLTVMVWRFKNKLKRTGMVEKPHQITISISSNTINFDDCDVNYVSSIKNFPDVIEMFRLWNI